MENEVFEKNLPPYLAHDLDAWKRGVKEHSRFLDCLFYKTYLAARFEALFDGCYGSLTLSKTFS